MKKVLIITYYWPPGGGAGVYRWLKMTKYLHQFGWEPIIYTAQNADYPVIDETLFEDVRKDITVIKHKIFEPYNLYRIFTGRKKSEKIHSGLMDEGSSKISFTKKIAVWIRGNIFIPDARKFWIKPSVKYLVKYLKENPVDAIVSTGPPHTTHLIAKGVKKKLNIKWIADFRDPWTQIDFYDQLMLSKYADTKHKRLEKDVMQFADKVVTVSESWASEMEKVRGKKVDVITNGFDASDYANTNVELDTKFSICHSGMMNADRNVDALWRSLYELSKENAQFKNDLLIRLIGKNDTTVYNSLEKFELKNNLELIDYLPHKEVAIKQKQSAVNLLPINNTPNLIGIIPGKLFEYLAAARPVLVIGPKEGDSAKIILDAQAGYVCDYENIKVCKEIILKMYSEFKAETLKVNPQNIEKYSRENLAGKYAGLLNSI
ncbi:MAG: glycosyltransferase family 4 protein [Fimbriimonadaceae bacterium]|nr:glycosyltransferase family 4 protein [Chitinophagales bacterium]